MKSHDVDARLRDLRISEDQQPVGGRGDILPTKETLSGSKPEGPEGLDASGMATLGRTPALDPEFTVAGIPIYGTAVLSPMDGYSDQPFRALCRRMGSAMSYTEFVKVEDILDRIGYVEEKLAFRESERPLVYQIYGDDPDRILEAALRIQERGPDIIDLNMGCPAKSISARGAGVGLMRTPGKIATIFQKLTRALEVPVTGKIRLGWDAESRNYLEVARIIAENGGALIAVHGRTKSQGYGGDADWNAIAEVVDAVEIPVIGNGDVFTATDVLQIRERTGCAAAMIGRAAMSNPWVFLGFEREDVPEELVRQTIVDHLHSNLVFYGPVRGLVLFRKFVARYLTPYRLPRDLRVELLTAEGPEAFLAVLDRALARERRGVLEMRG